MSKGFAWPLLHFVYSNSRSFVLPSKQQGSLFLSISFSVSSYITAAPLKSKMLRHQNISQVCFLCSSLICQIALQILILLHNVKEFKQLLIFEPRVENVNAKKKRTPKPVCVKEERSVQFRAVFMF